MSIPLPDLLERLALAAEQIDMPFLQDTPRDMKKWKPKNKYEALDDPGLPEATRKELEEEKTAQIEDAVSYIKEYVERLDFSSEAIEAGEATFRDTNVREWVRQLNDNQGALPQDLRRALERAYDYGISDDIIGDMIIQRADVTTDRTGYALYRFEYGSTSAEIPERFRGKEFLKVIDGLDFDALEEVAAELDNIEWKPRSLVGYRDYVDHEIVIDTDITVWYCITNLRGLRDDINEICDEREAEENEDNRDSDDEDEEDEEDEDTETILNKEPTKQLPKNISADQLAVLRLLETSGKDKIPSSDLRKKLSPTPWVTKLLDSNKFITPEAVLEIPPSGYAQPIYSRLLDEQDMTTMPWGKLQTIWDRPNMSFICSIHESKFESLFGAPMPEETRYYMRTTVHPHKSRHDMTVGWVRFTLFEKNVWIDEIQSDLTRTESPLTLPTDMVKNILGGVAPNLAEQFLREMRARGYQKFYMPDLETKEKKYNTSPPASIYTDLPKKLRFKEQLFQDTDLGAELGVWKSRDDRYWKLDTDRWMAHSPANEKFPEQYWMFGNPHDFGQPMVMSSDSVTDWLDDADVARLGRDAPVKEIKMQDVPNSILDGYHNYRYKLESDGTTMKPTLQGRQPVWVLASVGHREARLLDALARKLSVF